VYALYDLSKDEAEADDISRQDRAVLARMVEAFEEKMGSLKEIKVDPVP